MIYYLKCNNCGYYNKITSEYKILCNSCNKKLDNSFKEWIKSNKNKSFQDYQNEICLTSEQIDDISNIKPEKNNKKLKKIILLIIAIICLIGLILLGNYFYKTYYSNDNSLYSSLKETIDSKDLYESEWQTDIYDNIISINSPVKLTINEELAEKIITVQMRSFINKYSLYAYSKKNIQIALILIDYSNLMPLNIDMVKEGMLYEMQNQIGVKNFKYNENLVSFSDENGYLIKGEYSIQDNNLNFTTLLFFHNNKSYTLLINFDKDDYYCSLIAEKILNSFNFSSLKA